MDRLDLDLLITRVFENPPLWDRENKLHAKRNVVDKLWAEISAELDCEEALVKKKWKYLRDQYGVELKKFGDSASRWQYFHQLDFLRDVVKPRNSLGSAWCVLGAPSPGSPLHAYKMDVAEDPLESAPGEDNTMLSSHPNPQDTAENEDEASPKHRLSSGSAYVIQKGVKRVKTEDCRQPILGIARQNGPHLMEAPSRKQDDDDDEDILFFKSLLPHVRRISNEQKLDFRNRVQELVQHFAY